METEKKKNMLAAAEKVKRLMAEQLRQKNLQLEYARVERELQHLLPLVNEANLAANELERKIEFKTKMVKKLDPFAGVSSGKTEILINIKNNEEHYFYEWPVDKFENRLFMIRELLEEFFDTNVLPEITKESDPFWDPPNPILIGQSFLQLEPLSLMFENNLEAAILAIDGDEGKKGTIDIGYAPCTVNGETDEALIPDHLLVDKPEELIGQKDMYFKVFVKCAKNLPQDRCCNLFVTYQFKFEQSLYTTEEFPGINQNPKWNYSQIHKIDEVTKDVVENLKTGNISFMIFGYPPGRAKMAQNDGGEAAMKRRKTVVGDRSEFNAEEYSKIMGEENPDKSFCTDSDEEVDKPKTDPAKLAKRNELKASIN